MLAMLGLKVFSIVAIAYGSPVFHGFRFEIGSKVTSPAIIADKARGHACFGWVQSTPLSAIVGEIRCRENHGRQIQSWIESHSNAHTLIYPSTKIRYHFTSFRILESERNTCFNVSPHACSLLPLDEKDEL